MTVSRSPLARMSQCLNFDARKPPVEPGIREKPITDRNREVLMRAQVISSSAESKPTIADVDNAPIKSIQAITNISVVMLQVRICQVIVV